MYFVRVWEKIDRVIMAPHCICPTCKRLASYGENWPCDSGIGLYSVMGGCTANMQSVRLPSTNVVILYLYRIIFRWCRNHKKRPRISHYKCPFYQQEHRHITIAIMSLNHWGRVTHTCVSKLTGLTGLTGAKPLSEPVLVYCHLDL